MSFSAAKIIYIAPCLGVAEILMNCSTAKSVVAAGGLLWLVCGLVEEHEAVLGFWLTEQGRATIEIFNDGEVYFGRIAGQRDPQYLPGEVEGMDGKERVDLKNPDPELRDRPIQDMVFMSGFVYSRGKFRTGDIYDAETGKTYSGQFWLDDDGTLKLRGYLGIPLLGRNTTWTRSVRHPWTKLSSSETEGE